MRVTTEWTLSVISGCEISAQCRELNNAILYSERINWIPTIKLWGVEYTNGLDHALYYLALLGEMDRNCLLTQRYLNTCETLQKLGIKIQIPEGARCYEQRVRNVFRPAVRLFVKNPSDYQDFAARLTKLQHEEEARIFAENMALLPRSDAILFLDEPSRAVAAQGIWDTRVSTQALVNSLSSISFADVSDLNFDELILIKDRTKDMIDPVRAQLLRERPVSYAAF